MKEYFVFALILTLFGAVKPFNIQTTVVDGIGNSLSESMKPFEKIGENYYLIVNDLKTWLGAENYCRTKGAHLASIETDEEWEALSSYLDANVNGQQFYWIGANDIDKPFEFFWISSGQPMLYSKWAPNEPNNANGNERCVHLFRRENEFVMNDRDCSQKLRIICKANNANSILLSVW